MGLNVTLEDSQIITELPYQLAVQDVWPAQEMAWGPITIPLVAVVPLPAAGEISTLAWTLFPFISPPPPHAPYLSGCGPEGRHLFIYSL